MLALRQVSDERSLRRPSGVSLTFWLFATLAAGALTGLSGCASQSPGFSEGVPTELHTASDDTEARKRARTRLALATGYFENGQSAVALDEMKKALQVDPTYSDAYNLGGLIYTTLNDLPLAQAHFEKALSLNPRDANVMHNMGWLKCQQGQQAEATSWFQRAIAVPTYTEKARTWLAQGICEANNGQQARAEQSLMRSYELDPGNPVTGFNLSKLLLQGGDVQRAQFYIRRLNNSELANAESLWLGIKVERRLGNSQATQQLGSQLRRRFPQSKELLAFERGAFNE